MSKVEELEMKKMYDYLTGTQFKQCVRTWAPSVSIRPKARGVRV